MQLVAFAGEFAGEVRIAFPIRQVVTWNRAVAAGGKAAVGKSVGKYVLDRLFQFSAAGEVSASVRHITPHAVLVPVPRSHSQLSVVAICDRSPPRRKRFLNDMRRKNPV